MERGGWNGRVGGRCGSHLPLHFIIFSHGTSFFLNRLLGKGPWRRPFLFDVIVVQISQEDRDILPYKPSPLAFIFFTSPLSTLIFNTGQNLFPRISRDLIFSRQVLIYGLISVFAVTAHLPILSFTLPYLSFFHRKSQVIF